MAAVTLTTLRARTREHADAVNTQFVTDAANSVDAFINAGLDELYDLLVEKFGNDYFVSSAAFTTVVGVSTVALAADFYKLLGVDLTVGTDVVDLRRFEFKERNSYRSATLQSGSDVPRYRVEGSNLRLYPAPTGAWAGVIWYVPTRTLLVNANDSCNFPNGWEEFAVLCAAEKILLKEESDISGIDALKQAQLQRISAAAENRDAGEPARVTDTQRPYVGFDPNGWP